MLRTVLLVDDSDVCSTLMEIALSDLHDVGTVTVRSVQHALSTLSEAENTIALVITDLELPDEDGVTLVRRMREMPRHATIPVIVVTGVPAASAKPRLAPHGIAAFFEKPCSPLLLRRTVQDILNAH
jgi:two-component system chemotaxis response regulator CheY